MTARLPDEEFHHLVDLRANQGFNAAQVVVGIPPETTPENPNAASPYGPAWTRTGEFNHQYLSFARERMQVMNKAGLRAIIYGAWGPQINWLGTAGMIKWWEEILKISADLDVVYCLTGESNLHLGSADFGLNSKNNQIFFILEKVTRRSKFIRNVMNQSFRASVLTHLRRRAWSQVLESIAPRTEIPIIIHPNANETGFDCVDNPQWLAANTTQTGHTPASRSQLYQLPLAQASGGGSKGRGFINLEPWYEGIRNMFYGADQLFAYWTSMLAGSISYCYGAHGIWNVGDGEFLNHWGNQTFAQAVALDTPRLLGQSHNVLKNFIRYPAEVKTREENGVLHSLERKYADLSITFIPDVGHQKDIPKGKYWLPMEGCFKDTPPISGQVVIFSR